MAGFPLRVLLRALAVLGHLTAAWARKPLCRDLFSSRTDDWRDCRLQFGGLANQGAEVFEQTLGRVFRTYLTDAFNSSRGLEFEVLPLGFGEDSQMVHNTSLEFIFSNPAAFVCVMVEKGVRAVASRVNFRSGHALERFAGVIIARAGSNFSKPEDIRGARIAAPGISGLGGMLLQSAELLAQGINVMTDAEQVTFTGNQDMVVQDVQNGWADVGFVRTDMIERSVAKNKTSWQNFQVINRLEDETFPFHRSTAFTPEWVVGALTHVPHVISKEVGQALMALDRFSSDPAVSEPAVAGNLATFVPPMNYLDLLQQLESVGYYSSKLKRCVASQDVIEAVHCPTGWAKQSRDLAFCPAEKCRAEYTCLCHPCVRLKDPELLLMVHAVPRSWSEEINITAMAALTQSSPTCTRMARCATAARGQVLTWTLLDQIGDTLRMEASLSRIERVELRVGVDKTWQVMAAEAVVVDGLSTEQFSINTSLTELGEAIVQVRINGEQASVSPVLIEVFEPVRLHGIAAHTQLEWATTVDIAGEQRSLSQRISMEYLLIAHGHEPEVHRAALNASIHQYDEQLHCLIHGCPDRHILGAPSFPVAEALEAVVEHWTPFKTMLLSKIESVHGLASSADYAALRVVSTESSVLLEGCEVVMSHLLDAAHVDGAHGLTFANNIADRQRTVILRVCKETLLVALGVDVELSLTNLRTQRDLFEDALRGIITGAAWLGVGRVEKRCTLQALSEVTYEWNRFKSLLDAILVLDTASQSQAKAAQLTKEVFESHKPVFETTTAAVVLVFHDEGTCTQPDISTGSWAHLFETVARHRTLAQSASQLFMQIALGVDVDHSKVELTLAVKNGQLTLQDLIEGSKASGLPSPPTQMIVDELFRVAENWEKLQELFVEGINSQSIDALQVHQVSMLSKYHFEEMGRCLAMYQNTSIVDQPSVPASRLSVVGRQSALIAKMSKEALFVIFGEDAEHYALAVNATRELFTDVHWRLLLGSGASENIPALERRGELCTVQHMKVVAGHFEELQQVTLDVVAGSTAALEKLVMATALTVDAMDTAVHTYATTEPTCDPVDTSNKEWLNTLLELGELRALTQKVSVLKLTHGRGNGNSSSYPAQLQLARSQLRASVRRIAFGSRSPSVPAPFSQAALGEALNLFDLFEDLEQLLSSSSSGAAVSALGLALLDKAEELMARYADAASSALDASGERVSVLRLDIASRQSALCQKVVKEALLARFEGALTIEDMETSIRAFDSAHLRLRHGGKGVQPIITERPDLLEEWTRVDKIWQDFKPLVEPVALAASGSSADTLMRSLQQLESALQAATALFALADPVVVLHATEAEFPYGVLAYSCLAAFMFLVAVAGCVTGCWFSN